MKNNHNICLTSTMKGEGDAMMSEIKRKSNIYADIEEKMNAVKYTTATIKIGL